MQYLRLFNYLSLPVVTGAVLSHQMAARLSDVTPIHWATAPVLALIVWVIYTTDRLLDIRKGDGPTTARHRFHTLHARLLWWAVAGAGGLALLLSFWLPTSVWRFGLGLGIVCAAYVGVVFRLPDRHPALLLKAPLVALLFTAGIWGSVWAQRTAVSGIDWTQGILFLAIAFQNLLLFSLFEARDEASLSLTTAWGSATVDRLLRLITGGVVITALLLCFVTNDRFAQRATLMQGIMSLVLYTLQRYPAYFGPHDRYRWLGDGVFWLPALVL